MSGLDKLRTALLARQSYLEDLDFQVEEVDYLLERAQALPEHQWGLIDLWLTELLDALDALSAMRRAVSPPTYARLKAYAKGGTPSTTPVARKLARLEARVQRLLNKERPGPLQDAY